MWKRLIYWIPAVLATFALVTGGAGNFYCQSIKFTAVTNDSTNAVPDLYFGPWYQQKVVLQNVVVGAETYIVTKQVCVAYESGIDIDSKWKTVRAFSVLTGVIGAFYCFSLYLTPCYSRYDTQHKPMAICWCTILILFQGLYFLFLADGASSCDTYTPLYGRSGNTNEQNILLALLYPNQCEWSGGSTAAVIATVFWFLTLVSVMAIGTPERVDPVASPEVQEVTYQKTTNEDGTTNVVEQTVIKGHAVTETKPQPVEEPV